jgi:hypothetical protein
MPAEWLSLFEAAVTTLARMKSGATAGAVSAAMLLLW